MQIVNIGWLLIFGVWIVGLGSACTNEGPHKSQDVVHVLYAKVSQRTLPERKEIQKWWNPISFNSVKYVKERNIYEVSFQSDPYDRKTKETWGVDMTSETVWPIDVNALFSAIVFFCSKGREDPSPECRAYFSVTDKIKQALETPKP